MDKQAEINLLHQVITHDAGFIVDLFGGMLYVRSTMFDWEVGWEVHEGEIVLVETKLFPEALAAVVFFVEKRYELQLGVDFEADLMKENTNE